MDINKNSKKNVAVSACLLGEPCRYDGKSKPDKRVISLKEKFNLISICPEVLGGLDTPRPPSEIQGNKVVNCLGADVTSSYASGAEKALEIAKKNGCKTAILKSKSPSCGIGEIYDGTFSKSLTSGMGVTASLFLKNGIDVISEKELS